MLILSLFSLLTAASPDVQSLVLARVLAGVGLGGVFPSLIALIADAAPARSKAMSLGAIYCGLPLGGAVAGLVMAGASAGDWRLVFEVGGIGPLVVAAALSFLPPAAARPDITTEATPTTGDFTRLFGPRTETTLLLWAAYFFTLFAIYIQLNWMPSFLHAKGLTLAQASLAAVVLNLGAAIGSLVFGRAMDSVGPRRLLAAVYVGMALSLFCLAFANAVFLALAVFFAGLFVIGGQLVLYALGPMLYAPTVRGAGVGAAVAAGRGGAIFGPILAGLVLSHGLSPSAVPLIAEPGLIAACAAGRASEPNIRQLTLDPPKDRPRF